MRYYKLEVQIKNKWILLDELSPNNPNALHLELESVETSGKASSNITLTLFNPPNELLTKSFINLKMRLSAGLRSALPLADQKQIGFVAQGLVIQQIPNISSVTKNITYKLISFPPSQNYNLDGLEGTLISTLIQQALLPTGVQVVIDKTIENLKLEINVFKEVNTFKNFCNFLFGYFGIECTQKQGAYLFFKGEPTTKRVVSIKWQDIIGQPVGESVANQLENNQIYKIGIVQIPCHARGDLSVGDIVNLKVKNGNNQAISTSNFNASGSTGLDFAGEYIVLSLRHKLASRDANPESWCTTIQGAING